MKIDYFEKLDLAYEEVQHMQCPPDSKIEFAGSHIFEFTTYHGAMDEIIACMMLEVIDAILNRTTFKYIGDIDVNNPDYLNYLLMVNMPFLIGKIDWGGSIQGAWFDEYRKESYPIGCTGIVVPPIEIKIFMKQLIEWVKRK